jgi:hypothetical protein
MSKRLEAQSQRKTKLTLKDIEENSIDQLMDKPIPAFKETLKKMLSTNCEEIARLTNLNIKILKCLDRIDEQDQENGNGVGVAKVTQRNNSQVKNYFEI